MIEIIRIIGLEEYLELTNKFYEKLNKNIKQKNLDVSLAYDKTEFLNLMGYIIKKKMKSETSFISNLKKNIEERFSDSYEDPKDYNNSLIKNIVKIYSTLEDESNQEKINEKKMNEEKYEIQDIISKGLLDENTFNKKKSKKI